ARPSSPRAKITLAAVGFSTSNPLRSDQMKANSPRIERTNAASKLATALSMLRYPLLLLSRSLVLVLRLVFRPFVEHRALAGHGSPAFGVGQGCFLARDHRPAPGQLGVQLEVFLLV